MFRNSYNSKRSSLNAGNPAQRWRSAIPALVLLLIIGTVNPTSSAQAAPAGSTELSFFMNVVKEGASKPVCIGELVHINVLVYRLKLINGVSEAPEAITGISVIGVVDNPNIGQISPGENTTIWASAIYPGAADFVFTAEKPGETIVAFSGMIVNSGWFGTNWGGSSQIVSDQVNVKVIPCKFKVETFGQWYEASDGASYSIAAVSDEAMVTADADGHYTGSASVNWIGTGYVEGCVFPVQISSGQIHYTGEINESGQLVMNQTYEPVENSWNYVCGNGTGSGKGLFTSDSIIVSISSSGGVTTMPHMIDVIWWIPMSGSVTNVITPEEDTAVAFNPASQETSWNDILNLLGVSLVLH